MNVNRILQIRGGSVAETFRAFLATWWRKMELDAVLAPVELPDQTGVVARVLTRADDLRDVNPFAPVMLKNSALLIKDFIRDHPRGNLAAILRPCEIRAVVELRKRNWIHLPKSPAGSPDGGLTIIGVDCPGTYSTAEYQKRLRSGQPDTDMIRVKLAYDFRESAVPADLRLACQICDSPTPKGADFVIGTIGVVPQGYLLVIAGDEASDARHQLEAVTDWPASEMEVVCREQMVGKLSRARARKRTQISQIEGLPGDISQLPMGLLARCTLCADCLDACPLYNGELSGLLGAKKAQAAPTMVLPGLIKISRWLASCSGCGMCQEACPRGVALIPIVAGLSQRIQGQLHYQAGDPALPLPWGG